MQEAAGSDVHAGGLAPAVSEANAAIGGDAPGDILLSTYIEMVDPELREFVPGLAQFEAAFTPLTEERLPALRKAYLDFAQPLAAEPTIEQRMIPGMRDAEAVEIYIINALPGRCRPALVHLHGGGFVIGSARIDLRRLQEMARLLDVAIVSVEYRLAPETDWRGSLEDNYAALAWLYANAATIGTDRERIALLGESAGGGHAALLAIAARDRGEFPIAFQCLVYPMLDDQTGSSRILPPHLGMVGWAPSFNRFAWSTFLGVPAGCLAAPAAVPSRTADLRNLPPTWIGVGALDLFIEEDLDYARRLILAGVPTELLVVPGAFHGFDEAVRSTGKTLRIVRRFEEEILGALRRGLAMKT